MKYLKGSSQQLRQLFEQSITVRAIAEPLASFDDDEDCARACEFMARKNFDLIGVRRDGVISGYVERSSLLDGALGDHLRPFGPDELLTENASLLDVFERLCRHPRAFVVIWDQVAGIVTRGDLQKAPVRMWLFGLMSLIEMQLLRIIREYYPDDAWQMELTPSRLEMAKRLYAQRRQRNEEIGLDECLQLGDKLTIVFKTPAIRRQLRLEEFEVVSRHNFEDRFAKPLGLLRDRVAHSQDILIGDWQTTLETALLAEALLKRCEAVNPALSE